MFSRPEIIVPTDVLALRTDAIRKSPAVAGTIFKRNISRLASRFVKVMSIQPAKISGKVPWQSERQRKAFFASNGFGRGIPTVRTGALSKGWRTDTKTTQDGGVFRAINNVPYRRFVQGIQAQRMHINRYPQEAVVIPQFQREAQVIIRESWRTATDPRAGVR